MPKDRREITSALQSKGFDRETKGRDHDFYFFRHDDLTQAVFTKVSRGSKHKEIDDGLLGRMSRQLHLTRGELDDLVGCPMTRADFIQALVQRGVLVA